MKSVYLIPVNDGTDCGEAFGYTQKRFDVFPGVYDETVDDTNVDFDRCLGSYDTIEEAEALRNALEKSNLDCGAIMIYDNKDDIFM